MSQERKKNHLLWQLTKKKNHKLRMLKIQNIKNYPLKKKTKSLKKKFVQETEISSITLTLGSWSASTSPARSPPSPRSSHRNNRRNHLNYKAYGTTSLMQRSRSPSPARIQEMRERDRYYRNEMGTNMIYFSFL